MKENIDSIENWVGAWIGEATLHEVEKNQELKHKDDKHKTLKRSNLYNCISR